MTRQNFLLMLFAAGVGFLGLHMMTASTITGGKLAVITDYTNYPQTTKPWTVGDLYTYIRQNNPKADFGLLTSDSRGRNVMTADDCINHPEKIGGSASVPTCDSRGYGFTQLLNKKNLKTVITLQRNDQLRKRYEASSIFLSDTAANAKKFVKTEIGKAVPRTKIVDKYFDLLLSFDIYDPSSKKTYRFFVVDPYPVSAIATAKSAIYPVLTGIIGHWAVTW